MHNLICTFGFEHEYMIKQLQIIAQINNDLRGLYGV